MKSLSFLFSSIFNFFYYNFSYWIIKYHKKDSFISIYTVKLFYRTVFDLLSTTKHLFYHTCYKIYQIKHLFSYVHNKLNNIKQLFFHTFYKINIAKQSLCHISDLGINAKQMFHHSFFIINDIKYFICPIYDLTYMMNGFIHPNQDLNIIFVNKFN